MKKKIRLKEIFLIILMLTIMPTRSIAFIKTDYNGGDGEETNVKIYLR